MSDKKQYLLSLDFGTGAGKCFLISTDGEESFEENQEWAYEYPVEAQPGGSEFNAESFWQIFSDLIHKVISKSGVSTEDIIGISSTSQREGVVFIDKQGHELYAGPNLDMRAPDNVHDFNTKFADQIHASCGHWPFPMFLPYRLLWFKQYEPDMYSKIDSVLLLNNWMLYRLCGVSATEPSNGIETLLVNLESRNWNDELISAMGFKHDIFPPVYESGTKIGEVTPAIAEETGLRAGTPVILGGADSQCGLAGTGAVNDDDLGVVLGTYGPLQMVVPSPIIAAPELLWSGCHIVPEKWIIESTSMEAGQSFRWVRDVFYGEEKGDVYSLMSQEAEKSPIGANNIMAFIGSRLPNYKKLEFECPGGFTMRLPPLPGRNCRSDFSRATIEAVGFGVKLNADRLQKAAGREMSSLKVSGGLSKSNVMLEALANLLELTVSVPMQKEGSAIGAAICAGVGAGVYKDMVEGADALIKWEKNISPEKGIISKYHDAFSEWKKRFSNMYGEGTMKE